MNDLAPRVQLATLCVEGALAKLQEARTLDEVIDLRDQHDALAWLCRRRNASTAAGADAWLIARNAERRIGQMTSAMETAPGARTDLEPGQGAGPGSKKAALKSIGLTKQKASLFEQMAGLDEAEWKERTAAIHAEVVAGKPASNVLAHTSATGLDRDAYGTPPEWLEPGRELVDGFELDPASNDRAQLLVQAKHYFTKQDDARTQDWRNAMSLWMNPPFSLGICGELVALFVEHVRARLELRKFRGALLLTNNATDTTWWHLAAAACTAHLAPKGRISFLGPDGVPVKGNDHAQTLFYFGPKLPMFTRLYGDRGIISVVHHAPELARARGAVDARPRRKA